MKTIIVTRHPGLIEVIHQLGIAAPDTPIFDHVSEQDLTCNTRVIGVLPISLASKCLEVIEIPLNLPISLRGKELTADEVRRYMSPPRRYRIKEMKTLG